MISTFVELLGRINAPVLTVCRIVTVAMMAVIAVVVAVSVFWRYVLNDALSWSEEIAKYAMIWLAFAGSPLALPVGGHVGVDVLPGLLPRAARHLLLAIVMAFTVGLMGLFVWYGSRFAWNGSSQVMAMVGDVSMGWVFFAIPVGSFVMGLVALELALRHLLHAVDPVQHPAPSREGDEVASIT